MKSHQEIHGITSMSFHIHVSHTKTTCYPIHPNSMPIFNQLAMIHDLIHTKHTNFSSYQSNNICIFTYFMHFQDKQPPQLNQENKTQVCPVLA